MSQEVKTDHLMKTDNNRQLEIIGIVANIAWAYNGWKGFDEKGFNNKRKYGFPYVRETGLAHEWWNFYDKFDQEYYYGHVETQGRLQEFKTGLVIFISRNPENGQFYFVGFYGKADYSEDGFAVNKFLRDLLPPVIVEYLKDRITKGEISQKYAKYLKRVLFESPEPLRYKLRAKKDSSVVLLKEGYVPISSSDLGINSFKRFKTKNIGTNDKISPAKVKDLLLQAKQQHEALLNDPEISDEKKQNAKRIIEKIEGVLKEYFGGVDMNNEILRQYLQSNGYYFPDYLVSQFYIALKTKGFVILSGLTGTGKTKIALKFTELLEMPQLMSASGKNTKAEKEIDALQNTIKKYGFAVYGWKPAGKAKNIKLPFIFWLYDSDPSDKFYQKVPYGIIVSDVWTDKENLPKEWKSAIKWVETVYRDESIEKYINEHDIFFKVWKVIKCGSEISKFRDIANNRELSTQDGSRMQNGYVVVKSPEDCTPEINNHIFLSVRPDWRDSKALLGYYNPLTGEYHKTSLLEFILKALADYEKNRENAMPYFIILDEMNLAHVEYYFADFLSVFESGRDEDGFTKESIKLHDNEEVETFQGIPKELKLPPNLYIIGTVNMDETTYSFSPKVLDRAFVVEFHDVELGGYPPNGEENKLPEDAVEELRGRILSDLRRENGRFLALSKDEINKAIKELKDAKGGEYWQILKQLNKALEPYDLHFGYRVVDEIALFFQSAKESQDKGIVKFTDDDEIFDLALLMKVLPKFHGNRKKLEEPLKAILELCRSENAEINIQELGRDKVIELLKDWETQKEKFRLKHTARKVLRMLRQLYEIGFASFS